MQRIDLWAQQGKARAGQTERVALTLCTGAGALVLSGVRLFATLWTVAYQASPSMGFSRQESQSGLPFPSPGDLPESGIEPRSPTLQADALLSEPPGKPNIVKGCALK